MQPKWDKYEAAILLEAVIEVEHKREERKEAIKRVSNMLRAMAIKRDENIDAAYRNINGITFQFRRMEFSAFRKVGSANKVGTKLFDEVVALRNNDFDGYQEILKHAHKSGIPQASTVDVVGSNMGERNNKELFRNWLRKTGEKENTINWILECFDKVSNYAIEKKQSIYTIWEINNVKQYKVFVNTLQSFKFFRVLNKDLIKFLQNNAKLYTKFLKENFTLRGSQKIVDLTEYVISDVDREVNDSYPELFKQVYLLLKENSKHNYLTLNQILEACGTYEETVVYILDKASWAEKLEEGYILGKNNAVCVTKKISLNVEDAYAEPSDIERILISIFKRGYRPISIMDRTRFESAFEEQYGAVLTKDELLCYIEHHCFIFDDRFFLPKAIVEKAVAVKIVEYIEEYFEKQDILFYDVLFGIFKDSFNSYIYSAEMLVEYMKATFDGTPLYYNNKFFSYKADAKPNITSEVENYLINADRPCSYDEIYGDLSHLNSDDVYSVLHYNNPEILGDSKTEYFHLNVAHISEHDKKIFNNICETLLRDSKYITCNEIIDNLAQVDNDLYEKLVVKFSILGIRRILTYYLRDKYDVITGVITPKGKQMTIAETFADFARSHNHFTVANVQDFAIYTGTVPYWESIHQNSIRINRDEFVSEDALDFDIDAIDNAIAFYCDDYLPLSAIVDFMRFPVCVYPWNTYLLQQYVYRFSELFKIEFLGFAKSSANGLIVKKQIGYTDFDSIVIDALARTNIISKDDALKFLCDRGFITDRRYKKVEALLKKAIVSRKKNNEM